MYNIEGVLFIPPPLFTCGEVKNKLHSNCLYYNFEFMSHIDTSSATFQADVLSSSTLTLVDFWAPWCGPCRMLAPVLEQVEALYGDKLRVVKANVDEDEMLAMKYQISSIPCVKFFKDGQIVSEFVGLKQVDELKKIIDGLLDA